MFNNLLLQYFSILDTGLPDLLAVIYEKLRCSDSEHILGLLINIISKISCTKQTYKHIHLNVRTDIE